MKSSAPSLVNVTNARVRFSEVDSMQVVWHGEYVRYLEDGREAFGRQYKGLGYMDIHRNGYTAPVVELHLCYLKPLSVDDEFSIETRYFRTEGAKICFEYILRRLADGEIVATGDTVQVFLDSDGEISLCNPAFYNEWKRRWIR